MKVFKKTIILFIITSFFLLLFSSFCFADRELELVYPELGIPNVETPTVTRTILTDFVKYVFTLAISIAGLLAFGALIYGGFRYLTSAGDPTKMSDGKGQVMAGFLGLIILLSSYLILNTIDPRFVMTETPNLESLEQGIYAYVKIGCVDDPEDSFDDPVPIFQSSDDLSKKLPGDANGHPQSLKCIKFRSSPESLKIEVFSEKKYEGSLVYEGNEGTGATTDAVADGQSIKMNYYLPGVYLFANNDCTGEFNLYQSSSATLPEFDNKTQSIMFIYGDKNDISGEYETKYAAILHQNENFMGQAMLFDQEQGIENCKNLSENLYGGPAGIGVSSITVYLKPVGTPSGEGVQFWGDKGYTNLKDQYVFPSEGCDTSLDGCYKDGSMIPNMTNIEGENANDKITSMKMVGPYVALLFDGTNYSGECEVFMSSCPDFRSYRIGQCGFLSRGDCLSSFIIKARK